MQHTILGGKNKKLEDDLVVDVDPMNYEPCTVWHMPELRIYLDID